MHVLKPSYGSPTPDAHLVAAVETKIVRALSNRQEVAGALISDPRLDHRTTMSNLLNVCDDPCRRHTSRYDAWEVSLVAFRGLRVYECPRELTKRRRTRQDRPSWS